MFHHSPVFANSIDDAVRQTESDNYAGALKTLDALLKTRPGNREALFLKGSVLARMNRKKEAIVIFKRLTKIAPELPEPYNNLAVLYASQGDLKASRQALEDAMETNKNYSTVYDNLSAVYIEMARESYVKALEIGEKPEMPRLQLLTRLGSHKTGPAIRRAGKDTHARIRHAGKRSKEVAVIESKPAFNRPSKTRSGTISRMKNKNTIIKQMKAWARAWSRQDVTRYLSFYSHDFRPDGNISRNVWVAKRRARLAKPAFIDINLSELHVFFLKNNKVVVKLVQDYKSDTFQDRAKKEFALVQDGNNWKIISEKSVN